MRRRLETRSAGCCTRALLSYPSWKKAAGWLFFSAEPIAHRGQREGEGKTDTVNVCVLPFPKSQSRNMSGELHKQRRRVLVSVFFFFPLFFLNEMDGRSILL